MWRNNALLRGGNRGNRYVRGFFAALFAVFPSRSSGRSDAFRTNPPDDYFEMPKQTLMKRTVTQLDDTLTCRLRGRRTPATKCSSSCMVRPLIKACYLTWAPVSILIPLPRTDANAHTRVLTVDKLLAPTHRQYRRPRRMDRWVPNVTLAHCCLKSRRARCLSLRLPNLSVGKHLGYFDRLPAGIVIKQVPYPTAARAGKEA